MSKVNASVLDEFGFGGVTEDEEGFKGVNKFLLPDWVEWFLPKTLFGKPDENSRRGGKPMSDVFYRPTSWEDSDILMSLFGYNVHAVPYESGQRPLNILCGTSFKYNPPCGWCSKKIELERAKWRKPWLFKFRNRLITTGYFLIEDEWRFMAADWNTYNKNAITYRDHLNRMALDANKHTRIDPKRYAGYGDGAKVFSLNYTWMGTTREKETWLLTGISVTDEDATLTQEQEAVARASNPADWLNPESVDSVSVDLILDFYESEESGGGVQSSAESKVAAKGDVPELEVMGLRELKVLVMTDQADNDKASKFADIDLRDYDAGSVEELRQTIQMLMGV